MDRENSTGKVDVVFQTTGLHNAAAPMIVALALWVCHTWYLTGRPLDRNGMEIVHNSSDPRWHSGVAAGRVPSLRDIMMLPTVPFLAAVAGQREPYGGRLDPLIILAPLALLFQWSRLGETQKRMARKFLLAGVAFFLILAPVLIKTRFHIYF